MAYTIYKADGTAVVVPDNTIDSDYYNPNTNGVSKGTGTQLIGRNAIDYGAPVAQAFLQLTENFCGPNIPGADTTNPLQGQLWFNKTNAALYVRVTSNTAGGIANWEKVVTISSSETGTTPVINPSGTPKDGDIRIVGSVISIYAAGSWRQVFPAIYS